MTKTYTDLVNEFRSYPRDIHTVPKQKGVSPVWFYTYEHNGSVYVAPGRDHTPASRISSARRLKPEEFDTMLDIHHRREQGERVSQEAGETTVNQVYWYGIFREMGW